MCIRDRFDYPYVEANNYLEFKNSLITEFNKYGVDVETVDINDLSDIKNSIIVVPTGRMPRCIYNSLDTLFNNSNTVIYIGRNTDLLLDFDGALGSNDRKLKDLGYLSINKDFGTVYSPVNNTRRGYLIHISNTLNEFSNLDSLAAQLVRISLLESWEEYLGYSRFTTNHFVGKKTLFTSGSRTPGSVLRVIYEIVIDDAGQKLYGMYTSGYLKTYSGMLSGPKNILPDQPFYYELYLNASYDQPVRLVLDMEVYKNGVLIEQLGKHVDDISIKNVWNGRYRYDGEIDPGDYLFVLKDQYGNIYSKMYLHVYKVKIRLLSLEGNMYRFQILLDDQPLPKVISTDSISIAFDDGAKISRYISQDGVFEIYTYLSRGEHTMTVYLDGAEISGTFNNERLTIFDLYIQYGIIGLVIAVIIIVLFRHKPRLKYTIVIPKFSTERMRIFKIKSEELLRIFELVNKEFGWKKLPLRLNEIRYGIRKYASKEREIIVMDANLEKVLDSLVMKNLLYKLSEGYYAPKKWYKDKEIAEQKVIARLIRDKLIENGVRFKEKGGVLEVDDLIITPITDDSVLIRLTKHKEKTIVVFKDDVSLQEYLKSLSSTTDKDKLKVSILITNNRIFLTSIDKLGDLL